MIPGLIKIWKYVDDAFFITEQNLNEDDVIATLNKIHPCIQWTINREIGNKITFLDVEVSRRCDRVFTVFRKPGTPWAHLNGQLTDP
ncbi:hypothetical protein ACOME3_007000 [Neoechinorhynchus agilis]